MSRCFEKITNVKDVYISSQGLWFVNEQSMDCLELIVDTGERMFCLKHYKVGDICGIKLDEVRDFNKNEYKYKVFMQDEVFTLEKVNYTCDGFVDAIKFKYKDVFLFVFADEYNLILTKSKCDLLDDTWEIYDEEATLTVVDNV